MEANTGSVNNWRFVVVLIALFVTGAISLVIYVIELQTRITTKSVLESAKFYSDALSEFRTLYTSEVINRISDHSDITVTHDYQHIDYAIPLPVTFSSALGERISKYLSGTKTHIYSAYPFPWRHKDGGLSDEFRRNAWEALQSSPNKPYYQFTTYEGKPALRYATADLMRESCISCHNNHSDTPKNDWQTNDVRGVLEIIHPMAAIVEQREAGTIGLTIWTVIVVLFGVVCLLYIIIQFQENTKKLEKRVKERTQEVKNTEHSLRESMEFNNRLLETVHSIIIGVDTKDNITFWNSQSAEYFHLDKEYVVGKKIFDIDLNWDWQTICKKILGCMATEVYSDRFEIEYINKNLGTCVLSLSIAPILSGNDKLGGYLIIADDITEQKTQESKKHQMEKLQSIGQLAAGIAHEINTPIQYLGDNTHYLQETFQDMNNILTESRGFIKKLISHKDISKLQTEIDNLYDEYDVDYIVEDVPKAIEQSLEGIERVTNIVKAMKDFSHPGSQEKDNTDINRAIDSTITVSQNVWKYIAEMQTEYDPQMGEIPCLRGPFNEVILNMIVNAAHAIEAHIDDKGATKGLIKITTKRFEKYGEINIKDTGHGISKNIQEKIFDPFFTTKEVGKGTGQGLSLSHNIIVEQHNGELLFESEEGEGTTFTIRLPIN